MTALQISTSLLARIRLIFLLGLSVLLILFVAGPLEIFADNQSDFILGFAEIEAFAFPTFTLVLAAICILGALTSGRVFVLLSGLLLGLSIAIYLQGFILNWNYGVLDGSSIEWGASLTRLYFDLIVWSVSIAAGISLVFFRPAWTTKMSAFLLLLCIANILSTLYLNSIRWRSDKRPPSLDQLFALSSQRNVVFVLLDAFQSPLFAGLLEREPRYKQVFKDFTFFSDTTTSFTTTTASVPSILSGTTYRNRGTYSEFMRTHLPNKALPEVLVQQGFQSAVITLPQLCTYLPNSNCLGPSAVANDTIEDLSRAEALQLFDLSLFRFAPEPLKQRIYSDQAWFLQRLFSRRKSSRIPPTHADSLSMVESFERNAALTSQRPAFLFLHLFVPHAPQLLNSRCQYLSPRMKISSLERHSRQALCAMTLAESIITRLKQIAAYDNALVVILADHGSSVSISGEARPTGFPKVEQALPLLLIKRPYESRSEMALSDAPAMLIDLPKTVATALELDFEFPGENIFELNAATPRRRVYNSYRWEHKYWLRDTLPPMTEFIISANASSYSSWSKGEDIPALE